MTKMTPARKRVLKELVRKGGSASPYDLGYPRSPMMHELVMGNLIGTLGPTDLWGEPRSSEGGKWVITDAGRKALEEAAS